MRRIHSRLALPSLALTTFAVCVALTGCSSDATDLPDSPADGGVQEASAPNPDGGRKADPNDPNNASKDTDCDGLSDAVEFTTLRNGKTTDPNNADTDGDGLPDGLEVGVTAAVPGTTCTITADADPSTTTDPLLADTDGDGLSDGAEDANHDGAVSAGETDPSARDTDCDGLVDGPTNGSTLGEDGTSPLLFDTDGDGLSDGVERGVTALSEARCADVFVADADPTTTTDPTVKDTDGDLLDDGLEDANRNGKLDPGETNPSVKDVGPTVEACAPGNRRGMTAHSLPALFALALPTAMTTTNIVDGGNTAGYAALDPAQAGLVAITVAQGAGVTDSSGLESALRPTLAVAGALENRVARRLTTWDGDDALLVTYDQTSTLGVAAQTNALIAALAPTSTGRLAEPPGAPTGNVQTSALFIYRPGQSALVLLGVAPAAGGDSAAIVIRDFVAGPQAGPATSKLATECQAFETKPGKVDFLFVVDDSGSMTGAQTALASTVQPMAAELANTQLDWRAALVTSTYLGGSNPNSGKLRRFTRNPNVLRAWFTQNSACSTGVCSGVPTTPAPATCPGGTSQGSNGGCWAGISGNGSEALLGSARKAVDDITPGTAAGAAESDVLARADASLIVVLLGDADDQTSGYTTVNANCGTGGNSDKAGSSCEPVSSFTSFFVGKGGVAPTNKTGAAITVHGIVCPSGEACGCTSGTCDLSNPSREFNPQPIDGVPQQRHAAVVSTTGGLLGSIRDQASISSTVKAIVVDAVGRVGQPLRNANPMGPSFRLAVSSVADAIACNANDMPRSTTDGFDVDSARGTISFFGACRPPAASQAAVSFTRWAASK